MTQSMSSLSLFLLASRGKRTEGVHRADPAETERMTVLKNYIIRVYRRDRSDSDKIWGIVEDIESGMKHRFTTFGGLKRVLAATDGRPPRKQREGLPAKSRK